ncbi:MAG: hypothetical protein ICV53_14855 [Flavisolibacter sp.]|nr:hypothetical protein [Flavisolibacter sp.]
MHHGSGTGAGYTTNYSTFGSFAPALFAFAVLLDSEATEPEPLAVE